MLRTNHSPVIKIKEKTIINRELINFQGEICFQNYQQGKSRFRFKVIKLSIHSQEKSTVFRVSF